MIHWLLIALGLAVVVFAAVWAISTRVNNYGFLDVIWSYSVALLAPIYAFIGPGEPVRKWLFTALGVAWSLRLGTYILRRVLKHHPEEDGRYRSLRERWHGPGMFLAFFELQAVIAVIFSLPFLFVSFDPNPNFAPLALAGLALGVIGLLGEALADVQMQQFKAQSKGRHEVCQLGLWRYSRHPNYFFELLTWVAYFVVALSAPHGWIALLCPLLMAYFLFQVTGIPLTEKHSLESKGDAFREYQRTTSAFFPWFRKS